MPEENVIQFRAMPDLIQWLEEHSDRGGSIHITARQSLEFYRVILEQELRRLNLTEAEASLVCDSLNGTLTEPHTLGLIWANVDDSISMDGLDRKWGVGGPALVAKLRAMGPGQAAALNDAVQRFWKDPNPTGEALRRVGLVKQEREGR